MKRPRILPFLILTIPGSLLLANDSAVRALQSGSTSGPTPIHDRGIHGEGQIIAILDTGLDWDNCYFAEPDGSPPPINAVDTAGALETDHVDPSRRKVIAYDFLYSCAQYPTGPGCDDPSNPGDWDNQGHGTHAAGAATGDRGEPIVHDHADAIAPAAKLVIQDAGYIGGDDCSQRPGLGCPLIDLRMVLGQAYGQGARIHSNSWGDRQGTPPTGIPPTGNYSRGARDIDEFVWNHPDMVVVFNTGNGGSSPSPWVSSPGNAKNTIQVGGLRWGSTSSSDVIVSYSGVGPTSDGRIKPDLVGPARVVAGDSDFDVTTGACHLSAQDGTSWSSPVIAGAAALVRQFYEDGYAPYGIRAPEHGFTPSAALVKATLIASGRMIPFRGSVGIEAEPLPSFEQGFGVPVLDRVLHLAGDPGRLEVFDVSLDEGLQEADRFIRSIEVRSGAPLTIALVWTDPPGAPAPAGDRTPQLVNDLDLIVRDSSGAESWGNAPAHAVSPDRLNNVEVVRFDPASPGRHTIEVLAHRLEYGPRQSFALVITGDFTPAEQRRRGVTRDLSAIGGRLGKSVRSQD